MAREILIADGNKAAHKAFEEIFKETDFNLIFSENGEDALLKMKLFKPALVIADVTMPDKNGKELCQVLKGDPNLNKVPFVLLGGPFDEDIEEEKSQVRADGTITKPLHREPILKLVDGLLTAEPAGGTKEPEEEILELQPMAEAAEGARVEEESEVIELVDLVEEPIAKPEAAPLEAPGEVMRSEEAGTMEEAGLLGDKALADLQVPEDIAPPRAEEETQIPGVEQPGPGPEAAEKVDVKTEPAEVEDRTLPQEEEFPASPKGAVEPERAELGAEGVTEEVPTEGIGEFPQDVPGEKGLEEALAEKIQELPVEGTPEPERAELGAEGVTEEVPTEGIGEFPQDVLKEKGLEEALSEEIEELSGDLLGEKAPEETSREWEDTPDKEKSELEGLEKLGKETETLREEEGALEEALRELPGEALEEGRTGIRGRTRRIRGVGRKD
jgi:CheY-like chemotaxis protein